MEYALLSIRNFFTAFFNFCSDLQVVEGVTVTAILVAVFVMGIVLKRYHI